MTPKILTDYLALPNEMSKEKIQNFLNKYSVEDQSRLIACMYIGREHLHVSEIREPSKLSAYELNKKYFDHIESSKYAEILYSKYSASKKYLEKLIECAHNSNFDLNTI